MKALQCTQCGAPMSRGAIVCEYCGTEFERKPSLTEEERHEINERMRRGDKISFAPAEEVIVIRTEEDRKKLLMDAGYLSPSRSADRIARLNGKRIIWEIEA